MFSRLISPEKHAIAAFAVLTILSCLGAALYRWIWVGAIIVWASVWIVVGALAISRIIEAIRDDGPVSSSVRLRTAVAMPLAIAACLILYFGFAFGPRVGASIHLAFHAEDMRAAQRAAGNGRAASIPNVQGIPDGGSAIIRSTVNPRSLPILERYRLTGGHMHRCWRIVPDAWLCSFG